DYQVCDNGTTNGLPDSKCATGTVMVTITDVNDNPVPGADNKSTSEDTTLNFPASDLTANDSAGPADEGGQTLTVSSVTATANTHGAVSLSSGTVSYVPEADYNGAASFDYQVCDNGTSNGSPDSKCATGTVNVTISETNDNPVANADSKSTNEDTSLNFPASDLTTNDSAGPANESSQTLTVTSVTANANTHGTVSMSGGTVTYSPASNYNGPASFAYQVCDNGTTNGSSDSKCAAGSVNVTVNPVNDAPTANSQSVYTNGNTPVLITLTGSDVETSSGNLTYTVTSGSGPSHGILTGVAPNLIYTPALNYCGVDSFRFTVTDTGDGSSPPLTSSEATVTINVNDTVAPTITLNGNQNSLTPANHSYHTVNVTDLVASASDSCDPNVNINSVVISQVSSDEGASASGDIVIASDCKSVQLRAERNGGGDGRVYTITFRVRDAAGNTRTAIAKVTVPQDQGNGSAVDSGPAYTVISGCP
ncbi:MAG: hypothetical protein DMF75_11950, partial [Acidobacteria bacterium]